MDIATPIEKHRTALLGVLASLVALLEAVLPGFDPKTLNGIPDRLSRTLRVTILRVLRPAEAAVRRLIVASLRGFAETPLPVRASPAGGVKRAKTSKPRLPLFRLEDPREPMVASEEAGPSTNGPRILSVAPIDPTVPALWASRAVSSPQHEADDSVTSTQIVRRLIAIRNALDDLPRQAKRLQRWIARRKRISETRFIYTSPLRHGRPPGLPKSKRKRTTHKVEDILADCQWLAFEARRDTS